SGSCDSNGAVGLGGLRPWALGFGPWALGVSGTAATSRSQVRFMLITSTVNIARTCADGGTCPRPAQGPRSKAQRPIGAKLVGPDFSPAVLGLGLWTLGLGGLRPWADME